MGIQHQTYTKPYRKKGTALDHNPCKVMNEEREKWCSESVWGKELEKSRIKLHEYLPIERDLNKRDCVGSWADDEK